MSESNYTLYDKETILSFNFSCGGDKAWIKDYNEPLQIMPQTTKIPLDNNINTYPLCERWRDSVIHTSYITRPFNNIYNEEGKVNSCIYNIKQYIKLCRRIKYKRLLIHLPATDKEIQELGNGFGLLKDIFNENKDIILVLEIPAFKAAYKENLKKYFKIIIENYFKLFIYGNIEICFDTAHLFSNGLDSKDIVDLMEYKVCGKKLIDYSSIIHFNGNVNPMFKSDKHVQIFDKKNKMTEINLLTEYLRDKNKILISENTTIKGTYKQWLDFVREYGLKIVPSHPNISA